MSEIEFKQEEMANQLSRFKVIGGWLIVNMCTGHLQFISDVNHVWKIKETPCAQ
jgi:hypothetical protein